jgi:ABC-type transporter Mla subunit MlaD
MADHEFPGPTQPEARGGDSIPPSTHFEPRDGSGAAFFERLRALETAVHRVGGILTEQLPQRLARESGAQKSQLSELARELGGAFRRLLQDLESLREGLPDEISGAEARVSAAVTRVLHEVEARLSEHRDAVGGRVEDTSAALGTRLDETAAALRSRHEEVAADLRSRVDESAAVMAGRLDQAVSGLRAALDELGEVFQADINALRALPERLAEGMSAVREAVGEMAAAHGHIEERLDAVSRASAEEVRGRVDETSEALAARLGEAAGKLRWEVQDALSRVQEQLASLVGGIEGVRTDAEERASALQTGLERVDNLAEAVESIGRRRGFRQVVESDERLRQEQAAMVERLSDAGERLATRLEEVKQELEGLRKAAHDAQAGLLAEEIRRRVTDELVTEEMVQAVLERMQQSFERSFAELTAHVDARLNAAGEPSRRGLFRRAKEQA